jgi:hypothetical protein
MTIISGKDGTLQLGSAEVARLTSWAIEKTSAAKAYVANDTGGARRRVSGIRDCSGQLEIAADGRDTAPAAEGDFVALKLCADRSGNNYYELSAIVEKVRVQVDISAGTPIGYTVIFSGNGPIVGHGIFAGA